MIITKRCGLEVTMLDHNIYIKRCGLEVTMCDHNKEMWLGGDNVGL